MLDECEVSAGGRISLTGRCTIGEADPAASLLPAQGGGRRDPQIPPPTDTFQRSTEKLYAACEYRISDLCTGFFFDSLKPRAGCDGLDYAALGKVWERFCF